MNAYVPFLIFFGLTLASASQSQDRQPDHDSYPLRPYQTSLIHSKLKALTESEDYLSDVFEMERRGLNQAKTKTQPWGGYYWALDQGGIANSYMDSNFLSNLDPGRRDWKDNVKDYKKRAQELHPRIYTLSEDQLAKLSPSEKYDILLGDTTFDLTNKVWAHTENWGHKKKWAYLSAIDMPAGYVTKPLSGDLLKIASWEGICHGWALAAGNTPRPEKTVEVTLPNGKKMPFYPTDIKALVSLLWANSNVQNDVIFEGKRCNSKKTVRDDRGRYLEPECADVHPGVFHAAVVNIVGLEGRSLVVDKSAEFSIANQPVAGYQLEYFNPRNGTAGPLAKSLIALQQYASEDPFAISRNGEATHIVGVNMKLQYTKWESPKKGKTNSQKKDGMGEMEFNYDLEINLQGEIVGGQWRVKRNGDSSFFGRTTGQPDFFWLAPKNWKKNFTGLSGLPQWDFSKSSLPPKQYSKAALGAHSYVYEESAKFLINPPKCSVVPENGVGATLSVECAFRFPQPQPLVQVVDKLVELSRE
ncbi:MAG TPA: hypothetical protein VNJ01_11745 [Bacteriovoracaceae bacterium]|nr:hypothetical protein [Bacteriovoracaceae bacterium]